MDECDARDSEWTQVFDKKFTTDTIRIYNDPKFLTFLNTIEVQPSDDPSEGGDDYSIPDYNLG